LAVRIYSLAKELKFDSKELVDLCAKAGITGKGSALASLADDEVVRLKDFLASRSRPVERPVRERPLERPLERPAERQIKQLVPPKKSTVRSAPTEPAPDELAPPEVVSAPAEEVATPPIAPIEPDIAAASTTVEPAPALSSPAAQVPPAAPAAPATEPNVLRREDYIGPGGVSKRPPLMEARERAREGRKRPDGERKPPVQRGPAIKLAPMPTVKQPPAAKSNEPAPQKPDLKLPLDAIRAGRSGATPLSEHIRKHEEKRKADRGKGREGIAATAAPSEAARGDRKHKVRGPGGEEEFSSALGGREARQLKRKSAATQTRKSRDDDEVAVAPRRAPRHIKRMGTNTAAPRKTKAVLQLPATVRTFSEAVGVPASQVLGKLLGLGLGSNLNIAAVIDEEVIELLAVEFGVELEIKRAADVEETLKSIDEQVDEEESLQPRPPVITFLGHVDHGKTSLLDRIIGIDVASGESGGITQHIRAYQVEKNGRPISFVDTPGHEAFTEMRARGANVTDIAVLVVAADDGVMPQTEEAISHARAANVPIVVALNKIDLPGVDVQHIYQQLATAGLLPTDWGGDVEVVKTSAVTGQGIDDLLETLLTIAELNNLRANPDRDAVGTCLEAEVHEGRGVVAKFIVQQGVLRVGDSVVCGTSSGNIKAMYDTLDSRKKLREAGPSMPVNVTGLDVAPAAGHRFYALDDIARAREIAVKRQEASRRQILGARPVHVTLENLFDRLSKDEVQTLNIILRADVRGSIEAILKELTKLEHPEVKIKVLQATVGGVSEADIHLADASDAVVIAFNVVPDEKARTLAEQRGVQVRRYEIIYKVTEDLRASLEGMLKPEQREADLGRALVLRTFTISRIGTIAGCRVLSGNILRNARVRLIRENRIIGDYAIDSLKREKDDAREVREGLECGIKLAGYNDIKEGDLLEAYRIEEVARTL
jgi:translation initiation factor IF-2